MRIRTDGHTEPTIGADYIPVMETLVFIKLPALLIWPPFLVTERDRFAGAIIRTFLTDLAKLMYRSIAERCVDDQR